jgi:hypothetical protein
LSEVRSCDPLNLVCFGVDMGLLYLNASERALNVAMEQHSLTNAVAAIVQQHFDLRRFHRCLARTHIHIHTHGPAALVLSQSR